MYRKKKARKTLIHFPRFEILFVGTSGLAILQLILVRCRSMGQLECVAAGWITGYNALYHTLLHVIKSIELLAGIFVKGIKDLLFKCIQVEGSDFGQAAVQ